MFVDPSVADAAEVSLPVLRTCGHCGRQDVGSAVAGDASINGVPVCDPQGRTPERPRCLSLVMKYGHFLPCRLCAVSTKSRF